LLVDITVATTAAGTGDREDEADVAATFPRIR
jgi:hypothetical protein